MLDMAAVAFLCIRQTDN